MLEFKKELITPSRAKELLEANITNRSVKNPVVARYVKDILAGRWKEDTGELIKISKSGIVLDGQHRLHAIIKANKPLFLHIGYNINDEVFDVFDTGSSRSANDAFKISGIKNGLKISSILNYYNKLKYQNSGSQLYQKATNSELLNQYYENPIFWDNISLKSMVYYTTFKPIPVAMFGGYYAYFYKINPDLANKFIEQLSTGLNIENNVIALLRNKFIDNSVSIRKMSASYKDAYIIKAWNFFILNVTPKVLKYDSEREPFPEIALPKKISEQKVLL